VTGGGGTVSAAGAKTDSLGIATLGSWTIASGVNSLTASIPAPFRVAPVNFSATGVSSAYRVTLSFLTPISPARRAVFDSAAARWGRLIYGDLPDIPVNIASGACFGNEPAISQTIDDVLIFVTLDSIDGPAAILGGGGPCFIRSAGKLPLIGVMVFDTADVPVLEANGAFDGTILHEMAHVLGFGTIWDPALLNLLVGPAASGGTDPHFVGAQGIAAFERVGGTRYTGGAKVPVENSGGPGTIDSHWRESVFKTELMTGFLHPGVPEPLSIVTVASMRDEGYQVNYAAADAFSLSLTAAGVAAAPRAAPAGQVIALGDDVLRLPIRLVDSRGRLVGVYRP